MFSSPIYEKSKKLFILSGNELADKHGYDCVVRYPNSHIETQKVFFEDQDYFLYVDVHGISIKVYNPDVKLLLVDKKPSTIIPG